MELRVLRYFLAVVEEGGITKAAKSLHLTQPTLSRQLSQLQEELGVVLFRRVSRNIVLTQEGLLLKRRAEEILRLADKTEHELSHHDRIVEGNLAIGCGETSSVKELSEMIRCFHKQYPLVTFDLLTETADVVKEQLDKGLLDVGLLLEPIDIHRYAFVPFETKERWVVVMRADDPLTKKEAITASDLEQRPLILPRRANVRNEIANWFGERYEHLNILFTSNFATNSTVMVEQGMGYSLVVEGAIEHWDLKKIAYRPLSPLLCSTSVLVWKRNQPFNRVTSAFIDYIHAFKA